MKRTHRIRFAMTCSPSFFCPFVQTGQFTSNERALETGERKSQNVLKQGTLVAVFPGGWMRSYRRMLALAELYQVKPNGCSNLNRLYVSFFFSV